MPVPATPRRSVTPARSRPSASENVVPVRGGARREGERHPELGALAQHLEARRHHADHFVGHLIDQHRSPDHARVTAEALPPQSIGDYRDALAADDAVTGLERPADGRPGAEHGEEVVGDPGAGDLERLAALGDQRHQPAGRDRRDPVERSGPLAPEAQLFVRHRLVGPDRHQRVGTIERQRPQQHAPYHREHRGVGAGAEGEQQDGRHGERRPAGEAPDGQPQVVEQHGPWTGAQAWRLAAQRHAVVASLTHSSRPCNNTGDDDARPRGPAGRGGNGGGDSRRLGLGPRLRSPASGLETGRRCPDDGAVGTSIDLVIERSGDRSPQLAMW